jgi:hypothetical protein
MRVAVGARDREAAVRRGSAPARCASRAAGEVCRLTSVLLAVVENYLNARLFNRISTSVAIVA